jgi:hypothetical protein
MQPGRDTPDDPLRRRAHKLLEGTRTLVRVIDQACRQSADLIVSSRREIDSESRRGPRVHDPEPPA